MSPCVAARQPRCRGDSSFATLAPVCLAKYGRVLSLHLGPSANGHGELIALAGGQTVCASTPMLMMTGVFEQGFQLQITATPALVGTTVVTGPVRRNHVHVPEHRG